MTLNRVKLRRAFTFMKYFASVVSLMFSTKKLNLEWNRITGFKFAEFRRAGGKWTYEEYV